MNDTLDFNKELISHHSQLDTVYYQKMFDEDCKHFRIKNILKPRELSSLLSHLFKRYYIQLVTLFSTLQKNSIKIPGVSWRQVHSLISKVNIFNDNFTMGKFDELYKVVSSSNTDDFAQINSELLSQRTKTSNSENTCLRFEFIELLSRVALERYWMTLESFSPEDSLDQLMLILFNSVGAFLKVNHDTFRQDVLISDDKVKQLIQKNYKKIGFSFNLMKKNGNKEGDLQFEEIIDWMKRTHSLIVNRKIIWREFCSSKIPEIDEVKKSGSSKSSNFLNFYIGGTRSLMCDTIKIFADNFQAT